MATPSVFEKLFKYSEFEATNVNAILITLFVGKLLQAPISKKILKEIYNEGYYPNSCEKYDHKICIEKSDIFC